MPTVEELEKQKEALEKQIEEAKKAERDTDLATVKTLCKKHGFTATMLRGALKQGRKRKAKAKKPTQATD